MEITRERTVRAYLAETYNRLTGELAAFIILALLCDLARPKKGPADA
jgi:hypothetical protein